MVAYFQRNRGYYRLYIDEKRRGKNLNSVPLRMGESVTNGGCIKHIKRERKRERDEGVNTYVLSTFPVRLKCMMRGKEKDAPITFVFDL